MSELRKDARGKFLVPESVLNAVDVKSTADSRSREELQSIFTAHGLQIDDSGTIAALNAWSTKQSEKSGKSVYFHHGQNLCAPQGASGNGYRGLYANMNLKKWTLLLSVPLSHLLHEGVVTAESKFAQLAAKYNKTMKKNAFMAWFLMTEHLHKDSKRSDLENSRWKGFIDSMPTDMSHMPLQWQTKQLRELRGSFVRHDIKRFRTEQRKDFEQMVEAWQEDRKQRGENALIKQDLSGYTLKEYQHYAALVSSRHFLVGMEPNAPDIMSLAAYGDLYNHNEQLENVAFAYNPNHSCFLFFTTSDVKVGQELFVSYGPRDNGYLLTGYGFTIADNEAFNRCMLSYELNDFVHNFRVTTRHDERQMLKCLSLLRLILAPDPDALSIGWLVDEDGNPPKDQKMDGYDVGRMRVYPNNPFHEQQVLGAVLQGCNGSLGEFDTPDVATDAKLLADDDAAIRASLSSSSSSSSSSSEKAAVPALVSDSATTSNAEEEKTDQTAEACEPLDFRVRCAIQMRLGEKQVLLHWKALCEDVAARWSRVEDESDAKYNWSSFAADMVERYVNPKNPQQTDPAHRAYVQEAWGPWLAMNPNNE